MLGKLAVRSVLQFWTTWISLIIAAIALAVVMCLNIGLMIAGTTADGEAQQAFIAMGAAALSFTALTGFASFIQVVGICIALQRRHVALWQLAGVLPRTAHTILLTQVILVSAISATGGALSAYGIWPIYADFVSRSGLPTSAVLNESIPVLALTIGVALTASVSVLTGIRGARRVVRSNLVEALGTMTSYDHNRRRRFLQVMRAILGLAAISGVTAVYWAISRAPEPKNAEEVGNFLTSYPGMGILLCMVFAIVSPVVIGTMVRLINVLPIPTHAWFLAARETVARPQLTRALITPIALAAAAVGIMTMWIHTLISVFTRGVGNADSVSAPPEQMALLLGGPIVVACTSAAAVVFATFGQRNNDNALLLISGAPVTTVRGKAMTETMIYGVVALLCAYAIVLVNALAMYIALRHGPIPAVQLVSPGWQSAAVVTLGTGLAFLMLLAIALQSTRRASVSIILGSN